MTDTDTMAAFAWFGGKSVMGRGVGRWVLDQLPPVVAGQTYCEPFAGMLGVLLARPPADQEIVNDLDGGVAAFWRAVRDSPVELRTLLSGTEYGRSVFDEAKRARWNPNASDLQRAWGLAVCCKQSVSGLGGSVSGAHYSRTRRANQTGGLAASWRSAVERTLGDPIVDRLLRVQVECQDACEVIEFYGSCPENVCYCDPPYQTAAGDNPYSGTFDAAALIAAVENAPARIAISGYPDDPYDELGWRREEFASVVVAPQGSGQRQECLWMNYPPVTEGRLWN